jgi:hypothetical protein
MEITEHFNFFVVGANAQNGLSDFLDQCDGFTLALDVIPIGTSFSNSFQVHGPSSRSFSVQLGGMARTQSFTTGSSSSSMQSQNGWLPVLRVAGHGQANSDSIGNYDAMFAALEQIFSQTGVILPPNMTASLGLEFGVYVLSPAARAASSTIESFTAFLRKQLSGYENISIFLSDPNTHRKNDPPMISGTGQR